MTSAAEPRRRVVIPVVTLAVVASSVVLERMPAAADALFWERAAIERGELWRLFSGHLLHGSPRLAVLDLAALALFGVWIERVSRPLLAAALAAAALVASLALLLFTEYEHYVGSSALSSGLLVAAAVTLLRAGRSRAARSLGLVLLALFAGKVTLELLGVWPAELAGLPPGHETAVAAHIGGALGGGAAALVLRPR